MYTLSNPCSTSHKNKKRVGATDSKKTSSTINQEDDDQDADEYGPELNETTMQGGDNSTVTAGKNSDSRIMPPKP